MTEPARDVERTDMTALRHDITLDPDSFDDIDVPEDEQLDLRDRQALRRVAGLSTELEDVTEVEYRAAPS